MGSHSVISREIVFLFIFNMHVNNMDTASMLLTCMLNMNKNTISRKTYPDGTEHNIVGLAEFASLRHLYWILLCQRCNLRIKTNSILCTR